MTNLDKFIEEHIVIDELDGVKRVLVEFNFADWIEFKRNTVITPERYSVSGEIERVGTNKKKEEWVPKQKFKPKKKWTEEILKFIKDNLEMKNEELAKEIKKRFGLKCTKDTVAVTMSNYNIRREKDKKKHLCEECKEKVWSSWYKGKQLCKRCFDLKKKGEKSVKRKENKDPEAYERGMTNEEINKSLKGINEEDQDIDELDLDD